MPTILLHRILTLPFTVRLDYTNYRGERAQRRVEPVALYWGSTEWHPEPQLLLEAVDLDKDAVRTFSVRDIHGVEHVH
jgi:predicted DNA-binding transcriptional regulator YafY